MTDAFRRPDRFEQFLLCCEADARGRTGLEERDYPQPEYFRQALKACQNINTTEVINRGLSGKEFGDEINRLRLEKLVQFKNEFTHD